jgi:beta-N-acetylhexosaminidase
MLDLRDTELNADEAELLRHPLVGGVILFSRNYTDPQQLTELTRQIHALRQPPLLIAVDHEGGRVQRFRGEFTRIPPASALGELHDQDPKKSVQHAERTGWLLASELLATGVDFSFAPVLDLDTGRSKVIGDRAFHRHYDTVTELARAFIRGMKSAGMSAVGKHFPGHGYVREDSHTAVPVDNRSYEDLVMNDLIPFERLINAGIAGIMPAHVIYPQVDDKPAGFSHIWLEQVLRQRLNFQGVIFSDDISMEGAGVAGDYPQRALAALAAGCDMVLVCNNQTAAAQVLDTLEVAANPVSRVRLMRMHGNFPDLDWTGLKQTDAWQVAAGIALALDSTPELDLDDDEIPV